MNEDDKRKDRDPRDGGQNKSRSFALEEYLHQESKSNAGRPPHYDSAAELEQMIYKYILFCQENWLKLTISGLVLFCGFANRKSFYDYEDKPEFTHIIKRARTLIEMAYEENLHKGGAGGSIFALTNFGWENKLALDHGKGGIPFTVVKHYDKPAEEPQKSEE